jgi:hypothetical protein
MINHSLTLEAVLYHFYEKILNLTFEMINNMLNNSI